MINNIVAVGLDRGFGGTKYFSDLEQGLFDSLIAPISEKRAKEIMSNTKGNKKVLILKKDDSYYLVGSYVSLLEPTYAERDLTRSRNNENEALLFMVGMGLATGPLSNCSLVVTTGLPTADYEKMNLQYEMDIENNHEPYIFSVFKGSREFKKNLIVQKANVENQPKGTIITVMNEKMLKNIDINAITTRRYGIGDIGFNTADFAMYLGKDIIKGVNNNFSTFALAKILTNIQSAIEDDLKCKKNQNDIIDSLVSYKVKVKGVDEDCRKQVEEGFMSNAHLLVKEVKSKWESYLDSLDEIILTGGVVENKFFFTIMQELFKKELGWSVIKPEQAQMANAYGFYLISMSILSQQ